MDVETTQEALATITTSLAEKVSTNDPRLGGTASPVFSILNAATALAFDANNMVQITPAANVTLTSVVPSAGSIRFIKVLTSGTVSRTVTFGTGLKAVGTLATGTTSGRVFIITLVSDGTNLYEVSRTAAMVA